MHVTPVSFDAGQPVDGYGPGFFRLGDAVHEGPLAILPGGPVPWKGLSDLGPLIGAAGDIDVLFFGTGADIAPLAPDLRTRLEGAGIGVEVMATPPACRTYNVLLAEGRRVGLAVIPV